MEEEEEDGCEGGLGVEAHVGCCTRTRYKKN